MTSNLALCVEQSRGGEGAGGATPRSQPAPQCLDTSRPREYQRPLYHPPTPGMLASHTNYTERGTLEFNTLPKKNLPNAKHQTTLFGSATHHWGTHFDLQMLRTDSTTPAYRTDAPREQCPPKPLSTSAYRARRAHLVRLACFGVNGPMQGLEGRPTRVVSPCRR